MFETTRILLWKLLIGAVAFVGFFLTIATLTLSILLKNYEPAVITALLAESMIIIDLIIVMVKK